MAIDARLQILRRELLPMQILQALACALCACGGLAECAIRVRSEAAQVGQRSAMRFVHRACEGEHLSFHRLHPRQLRECALVLIEDGWRTQRLLAIARIAHAVAQRIAMRWRGTDNLWSILLPACASLAWP